MGIISIAVQSRHAHMILYLSVGDEEEVIAQGKGMYNMHQGLASSCEDFDDTVATCGDNEASVLAPDNAAYAFAAHNAVGCDFLRADALLEGPEADRGVVTSRYGFTAVFAEGEGGDSGWVGEHAICALT